MDWIRNVLLRAALLIFLGASVAWADTGDKVSVMTRNMDAGTDFGFFIANLATDPALGVQLTLQELAKNNFPGRAALLAKEIAAAKPDLVGLQEATIWTVPNPSGGVVVVDQLVLLLQALADEQQPYAVVAVNTLTNLSFPLGGAAASFTDRDVIIRRAGSPIAVSNVQAHLYQTQLTLTPQITVLRGWLSADASVGQDKFRYVTTHLESSGGLYGNPQVDLIQAAQAQELGQALLNSPIPVVIAGDLNSNATHTPPEQTQAVDIVKSWGFDDTWSDLHHGNPGFTWPLFLEDPLRGHKKGPFERIDFVFARGMYATSAYRTGLKAPYGSDHAGVVANFGF